MAVHSNGDAAKTWELINLVRSIKLMISNKKLARIGGFLYLIIIATGMFAELFVREALVVPGDVVATVQRIQASEMLYRWGFVADLSNFILGLPLLVIMYILFKPVNKWLMLLAIFFAMIQTAIISTNLVNQLSPLLLTGKQPYLSNFRPEQLATLSQYTIRLQSMGYAIGLVFFGFYCLIIGYLIWKSTLVPKIFGILYVIAGVSYLVNSFTLFLSTGFANPLFPYILVPAFIGEFSLAIWFVFKGVRDFEPPHR